MAFQVLAFINHSQPFNDAPTHYCFVLYAEWIDILEPVNFAFVVNRRIVVFVFKLIKLI
jgi:hypothetical protein